MPPSHTATMRTASTSLRTGSSATTTTTVLENSTPTTTLHPQRQRGPVPIGTLRLRAASVPRRGIRWAEDVVDNEGLGRKSSKVCCIYHKPHPVGESSSSDSSSSDDDDSDTEPDSSAARQSKGADDGAKPHEHVEGCTHGKGRAKKRGKRRSGNAYEKMKTRKAKGGGGEGGVGTQVEK
ncbi:hypothetical protein MMC34_005479 [Xylographa carneopallida]|nr:hypothetical protein [Xylographa carneopallida]